MLSVPFRCCSHIRCVNNGFIAISSNITSSLGLTRNYAKDNSKDSSCCKDVVQTEGRKVEMWPKCDPPPPAWRPECPMEPQPPNYDPYRIKVPEVVVPPLPPSNAKEIPAEDSRELFKGSSANFIENLYPGMQDLFRNSPIVHPDYWKDKPSTKLPYPPQIGNEPPSRLGYHGKSKYKFAFHEPWKPLDRLALLEQAEKEELEPPEHEERAKQEELTEDTTNKQLT